MKDAALVERIMREIWRVQYHNITGEWPDMRDAEDIEVKGKKEAGA